MIFRLSQTIAKKIKGGPLDTVQLDENPYADWPALEMAEANHNADESVEKSASPNTWFVYILRCADGSLYTGITTDLSRRCAQHNAGTASRYTRSRLPVSVAYQEAQVTRSLALKRELAIKAMSRQKKESLIRSVDGRLQKK